MPRIEAKEIVPLKTLGYYVNCIWVCKGKQGIGGNEVLVVKSDCTK